MHYEGVIKNIFRLKSAMINVVLADDSQAVRKGLKALIGSDPDFTVVGEAENGIQAVEVVSNLRPDVLVLDLMMPGLNGLEVIRCLVRDCPQTRIVVLSLHADEAYVSEALRCGAKAYILKESPPEELLKAIHCILHNICYLSPSLSESVIQKYKFETGHDSENT
jgi:two-component system response regulator NreC